MITIAISLLLLGTDANAREPDLLFSFVRPLPPLQSGMFRTNSFFTLLSGMGVGDPRDMSALCDYWIRHGVQPTRTKESERVEQKLFSMFRLELCSWRMLEDMRESHPRLLRMFGQFSRETPEVRDLRIAIAQDVQGAISRLESQVSAKLEARFGKWVVISHSLWQAELGWIDPRPFEQRLKRQFRFIG